jgi:hypothetical protein
VEHQQPFAEMGCYALLFHRPQGRNSFGDVYVNSAAQRDIRESQVMNISNPGIRIVFAHRASMRALVLVTEILAISCYLSD